MLLKDEVGMLRRVPLFAGVEPAKLKLLAFTSDRVTYAAGQTSFTKAKRATRPMSSLSGTGRHPGRFRQGPDQGRRARAQRHRRRDRHPVQRFAHRHRQAPPSLCEVLRIRKDHFLRLLREFPEMTIEIVRVLANRLSHTTAELIDARSQRH